MFAKLALSLILVSTAVTAAEPQKIIAMSEEDAATCESGCAMITKEAQKAIMERLAKLEALALRQAEELKRKPNPKFCL
jgi:hypothetical protein